eukprot:4710811-Alexandrium_andersonii.AAC.1
MKARAETRIGCGLARSAGGCASKARARRGLGDASFKGRGLNWCGSTCARLRIGGSEPLG